MNETAIVAEMGARFMQAYQAAQRVHAAGRPLYEGNLTGAMYAACEDLRAFGAGALPKASNDFRQACQDLQRERVAGITEEAVLDGDRRLLQVAARVVAALQGGS